MNKNQKKIVWKMELSAFLKLHFNAYNFLVITKLVVCNVINQLGPCLLTFLHACLPWLHIPWYLSLPCSLDKNGCLGFYSSYLQSSWHSLTAFWHFFYINSCTYLLRITLTCNLKASLGVTNSVISLWRSDFSYLPWYSKSS